VIQPRAWRVIAWMCVAHVTSMAGFSTYATLLPGCSTSGAEQLAGRLHQRRVFRRLHGAVPLLTSLTDRVDAGAFISSRASLPPPPLRGWRCSRTGSSRRQSCSSPPARGSPAPTCRLARAHRQRLGDGRAEPCGLFLYRGVRLGTSLSILLSAGSPGRWAFAGRSDWARPGRSPRALWVALGLPPRKPTPLHGTRMLDFRPVLASREVRPYIFGLRSACWSCSARAHGSSLSSCSRSSCRFPAARRPPHGPL